MRLAPPGTSKRLHTWSQRLAECVNKCIVPPWLIMRILMSLEAPSAASVAHNSALMEPAPARKDDAAVLAYVSNGTAGGNATGYVNQQPQRFEIGDDSSNDGDGGGHDFLAY